MGERYRKMNMIFIDSRYYIIMDDTTEIKKNNEISEFTASISVLDFNPQNYTMKMVF